MRTVDQRKLRLEDDDAGAFRPYQSPRHIESPLRKQFVEVVTGNPPRNTWEFRAYQVAILIPNYAQLVVNLAATPPLLKNKIEIALLAWPDGKLRAVVEQNVQLFNIVDGLPAK